MHSTQAWSASRSACLISILNANDQFSTLCKQNLGLCVPQASQLVEQHSLNHVQVCRKSDSS